MIDLLHLLSNRDNWTKYSPFIKENVLTKETKTIVDDLADWYDSMSANDIDWGSFSTWFRTVKHPMFKQDKLDLYQKIFDSLSVHTPNADVQDSLVDSLVARDYATRIYMVAQDVAEGAKDHRTILDVESLMHEYRTTSGDISGLDKHTPDWDIDSIMENVVGKGGLNWRLKCMNENVGPIRVGNFIIVGARPDTGKTTWLASEVTCMAAQLPADKTVLWFNNEEQGSVVQSRIIQAATGLTITDVETDRRKAMEEYEAAVGSVDKIKLFDKATLSVRDVNEALEKYDAGLIVFDQLRKVRGFEAESGKNDTTRLELLYNQGREWAKENAPVITVHQASSAAEGVLYPTMDMLHMSQTGIQGEADLIIMLGRSWEPGYEYSRGLHTPKNKLPAQIGHASAQRHAKTEIIIQPEIARFKDPEDM